MKKSKSVLCVLIAVCLLISSVPFAANAIEISDGYVAKFNITIDSNSSQVTSGSKIPLEVSWSGLENGAIETSEAITVYSKVSVSSSTYYRVRFIINNEDTVSTVYGTTSSGSQVKFNKSDDYTNGGKKYTTYKSSSSGVLSSISLNISHVHNYYGNTTYTDPTCTEPAYSIAECKYCHNQIKDALWYENHPDYNADKKPLGHDWEEQTVITEPTCEENGEVSYICTRCGDVKTDSIPATGHQWNGGTVLKIATCEESGLITYTCKNDASHTRSVVTDPIGHDWNEGTVTQPATCEDDGEILFTCENDPEHTKTEIIPAAGHELLKVEAAAATQEHEGNIEHWSCSVCGKLFADENGENILTESDIVIPKLRPVYEVSVRTDGNGSLTGDISGAYTEGTQLTVTAVENDNSIFCGWYDINGDLVSNDISYTFNVNSETELTAEFTVYAYCELNGDGISDIDDVVSILDFLLDTDSMPEKWKGFADVDGDGEVNLLDAYLLFTAVKSNMQTENHNIYSLVSQSRLFETGML